MPNEIKITEGDKNIVIQNAQSGRDIIINKTPEEIVKFLSENNDLQKEYIELLKEIRDGLVEKRELHSNISQKEDSIMKEYNWENIHIIITGNYFTKNDFVSVCQQSKEFNIIRDCFEGIEKEFVIKSNIYDCLKKQEFSVFESDNNKKLVYEFLSELKIRNNGVFREFPITDGNKEDKKQFLCENFNKYYKIGEIKPEFVKLPKLFVNQKSNFEITLNSIGLLPINASINSLSSFEKEILDNIVSNITIKTALELQKTNEYNTNFTSNELIISNNEKARWKLDFTPLKHEINLKYQIKINIDSSICSAILTQKYDFEEKLTCETKTLKETYEISHGRITDTFKDTMVINTFYTGKVIIADIKLSEKEFLKNLPKTAKTNIKDINIGKRMEVVLKNENEDNNNFEVVKHNEHKEQPIINGMRTEWSFKVKPLKLGLHTLILSGAIVFKDKDGDIHKEAVYTKKIEVIVKGQQVEQNENNTEQNEHKQSNKIQKITVDAFFIKDIDRLIELVDNTNENKFEIKKACLIDELTNLKNKKLDNSFSDLLNENCSKRCYPGEGNPVTSV